MFSIDSKKVKMKNLLYCILQYCKICIVCGKYNKFKNPEISYIFEKTLVPSIICSKCD